MKKQTTHNICASHLTSLDRFKFGKVSNQQEAYKLKWVVGDPSVRIIFLILLFVFYSMER